MMACAAVTGMVRSSSRVPTRRSSAHRRMPAAGTRNKYNHGCQLKKGRESEASPSSKNPPSMKVKKPLRSRKMTMNT